MSGYLPHRPDPHIDLGLAWHAVTTVHVPVAWVIEPPNAPVHPRWGPNWWPVSTMQGPRIPVCVRWFPAASGLWMWWTSRVIDGRERVPVYPFVQWHRGDFAWQFTPAGDWPGAVLVF